MPSRIDHNVWTSLYEQLETAIVAGGGMGNISQWISTNTRDPRNAAKPFSFEGHEYQIGILNDTHPTLAIRKATQVGASEMSVRLALAVCAKFPNISAIYVLPSIRFAQKFSMARADTVIEASPRLKAMADRAVFSNELKKIGSSFLYFGGAADKSSAISIPSRALFIDEVAFADPKIISTYVSRLGHQEEHERIVRYFSSPLHPHADISALYEQGTQNEYFAYHDPCGTWVPVRVLDHLVLPGFNDHLTVLDYADLDNPKYRVDQAYIKCDHCHAPFSLENLCDPIRRAWVPAYPDREMASYDAGPLVLPQYRTPQNLLRDLKLYKSTARWVQYSLGQGFESSSDMVLASTLDRAFVVPPVSPRTGGIYGACLGVDVGKTSHVAIGRKVGQALEIVWMETVRQDENNATGRTLVDRYRQYGCLSGVIDAAPDISTPRWVAGQLPYNQVWGCYFIRGRGKSDLRAWAVDEREGVVKVSRTRALDDFVEKMNKGLIKLPAGLGAEEEIRAHMQRLKRVINYDTAGEESAQWIASDPETHWFFAVFYAWLASEMLEESGVGIPPGLALGNLVSKVRLAA